MGSWHHLSGKWLRNQLKSWGLSLQHVVTCRWKWISKVIDYQHVFGAGIWEARGCCHFLHHTIRITLGGVCGGGVGWGGVTTSLARPHIHDATLLYALLHFIHIHTYVMLHCCRFSCTSIHTSCYAAVGSLVGSLAHPHIRDAALLYALLHFHACVMQH